MGEIVEGGVGEDRVDGRFGTYAGASEMSRETRGIKDENVGTIEGRAGEEGKSLEMESQFH